VEQAVTNIMYILLLLSNNGLEGDFC